ncbi:hypothetical protein RQP46_002566 [Phenoliferia psychrophenolica]
MLSRLSQAGRLALSARHAPTIPAFRPHSTESLASWRSSITSQSFTEEDTISLSRIRGLISTIELAPDGPATAWSTGALLPPGFSLLLFPQTSTPLSQLFADGTEPGGSYHPPAAPEGPLERMWVSGSWQFLSGMKKMRVGDEVVSKIVVEDIKERTGRDGLIVHGPLTCLLLLSALRHNTKTVKAFEYRATKPLIVGTDVWFCGKWTDGGRKECELWVEDAEGEVYMTGRAVEE